MQMKTPPPLPSVVKREDKMESLRTFMNAFWLASRAADTAASAGVQITVVARSAESPVARALVAMSSEIANRGIAVRAIFGQLEPEKTALGWSAAGPEIAFSRDLRWAKNPRLADAHEQLVLGAETCWIGDCLRRDPSRRDAYEQFIASDTRTSQTLQTSFERLWIASVPLLIRTPQGTTLAGCEPTAATAEALAALTHRDDNSGPLVSSQH